jgi:hypothetical protein
MQFHKNVPFQLERGPVKFEKDWTIARGGTIKVHFTNLYYVKKCKNQVNCRQWNFKNHSKTLKNHSYHFNYAIFTSQGYNRDDLDSIKAKYIVKILLVELNYTNGNSHSWNSRSICYFRHYVGFLGWENDALFFSSTDYIIHLISKLISVFAHICQTDYWNSAANQAT